MRVSRPVLRGRGGAIPLRLDSSLLVEQSRVDVLFTYLRFGQRVDSVMKSTLGDSNPKCIDSVRLSMIDLL